MSRFLNTASRVAVAAVAAMEAPDLPKGVTASDPATRPVYSPETFAEFEIGNLREQFPNETAGYDDITLFNVAMMPDDDLSDADWAELLLKHQPTKEVSELDGEGLSTLAQKFASRVSPETEAALETAVKGKEDWQGGPITVRAGLLRDFGKELAGFAVPNSKSGNNPDKYKMSVTDSNGKTSMRPTSFYIQFARGTHHGQAIVAEIAHIKRANAVDTVKDGIPESILAMTTDARNVRLTYLENKIKTMTAAYRKAMALHFQTIAFDELASFVDVDGNVNEDASKNVRRKTGSVRWSFIFETDENGEDTETVVNSPSPIMIEEMPGYTTGTGEMRPIKTRVIVSIGAFLKFNVATAMKHGGTFKALLATVARKPKAKAPASVGDTKTETVDQFVGRFVESFRYLSEINQAMDPAALVKLQTLLKTDARKPDGGELVVAVVEYKNWLDDLISDLQLNAAYTAICQRNASITGNLKKAV